MLKGEILGFLIVVVIFMILLSGCESSSGELSDVKDVRTFAGSVGQGDFINVEVNVTDSLYTYNNRIDNEPPVEEKFIEWGENFYQLDSGDYFIMLDNDVLIATNIDGLPGEQIITALSEVSSEYGSEIQNTYNIITSLEGNWGTVEVKSDIVDIKLTDGTNDEELLNKPYSYKSDFGAIEIIEDSSRFRHYGVFLDGEIGIFDSYWREDLSSDSWSGDGMSILVKQDSSVTLSDFEGTYNFVDVDSDIGTITISDTTTDSMKLTVKIIIDQETVETVVDNKIIESISNNSGMFRFDTDMITEDSSTNIYPWSMMLVPGDNKTIVIGTKDPNVFKADINNNEGDEDGGIFVGIEQ